MSAFDPISSEQLSRRVTGGEPLTRLLRWEEPWTSKGGHEEKFNSSPAGEESSCLSRAYQTILGYLCSEAAENWY